MTNFLGDNRRAIDNYNKIIWFLISIFVAISGTVTWASFQSMRKDITELANCVKDLTIRGAVLESNYQEIKEQLLYIRRSLDKH
jgi:hypothetical protein